MYVANLIKRVINFFKGLFKKPEVVGKVKHQETEHGVCSILRYYGIMHGKIMKHKKYSSGDALLNPKKRTSKHRKKFHRQK